MSEYILRAALGRELSDPMFLQGTQWSKSIDDLQSHSIHMMPMKNKKGETQGFRFMSAEEKKQYDERIYKSGRKKGEILGIKASDLGKEFSLKNMKKREVLILQG